MTKFSFPKKEKLKSKKRIEQIFSEGKEQFKFPFKLVYIIEPKSEEDDASWSFGISVPKKKVKSAVSRNLLKRRVREAFRLNRSDLSGILNERNLKLSLMFIYIADDIKKYPVIEKSVIKHLDHLKNAKSLDDGMRDLMWALINTKEFILNR